MSGVRAAAADSAVLGHWKIIVNHAGGTYDVTYLRGIPTVIGGWELADPFGVKSFSLTFGAVSILDRLGAGDLECFADNADVDIYWVPDAAHPLPLGYPDSGFQLSGYFESDDFDGGYTVTCKGAMYQLDNYLAKPAYLYQPVAYESAIVHQWDNRPDLRMVKPQVVFPDDWATTYVANGALPAYRTPTGVTPGGNWTGLATRATGSWDAVLTSYIQSLLTVMYTATGRWTLSLNAGRVPVLHHVSTQVQPDSSTLVIDAVDPGVKVRLSRDKSQTITTVFAQGRSSAGEVFSGQYVSADGQRTYYLPQAQLRQTDPGNAWLDTSVMRREVLLQQQEGLSAKQAEAVSLAHLQRFTEPGWVGSIELMTDPTFNGATLSRFLIKEGMTVQILGVGGREEGVIAHISAVSANPSAQSVSLTVDTKFRDALTVSEVMARTRDSLSVQRALVGGAFSPPLPDQLKPWSYPEGSGYIPSGPGETSAVQLFSDMPDDVKFPWTSWLQSRPPSSPAWRSSYIHLGPVNTSNATANWAVEHPTDGRPYTVRMSQAGKIRLLQLAAVHADGTPFPVSFHVSLYYNYTLNFPSHMPQLKVSDLIPVGFNYTSGQTYPYTPEAWETYNLDGTLINNDNNQVSDGADLVQGWGNGYKRAGYWPGAMDTDPRTGLLVDEAGFSFNTFPAQSRSLTPGSQDQTPYTGYMSVMIYCEDQGDQDVYFIGRMFREEPATQGSS